MIRFVLPVRKPGNNLYWMIPLLSLVLSGNSCNMIRSVGRNPEGEALKRIEALPNYRNGSFQNLDQTVRTPAVSTGRRRPMWMSLFKLFTGQSEKLLPSRPLIAVNTDLKNTAYDKPTVIWFGHSSFLLKAGGANILFDPSFSGFAGPFKGLINAFEGSNAYGHKDMPPIDALVISHDHYDHLDYVTVKKLRKKVKRVIVPVGVGSHFKRWGFPEEMITELNWNDAAVVNNAITITATPAHHRSNRAFQTRKTLWASYVISAGGYKIFFSGDTGYSSHFKIIGERYGPFDLAMMECGQYNVKWPQSHMFPDQTALASVDLKAAMTIPVHRGKYAESEHGWNESINRFVKAADSIGVRFTVPMIGQPYTVGTVAERFDWWNYF